MLRERSGIKSGRVPRSPEGEEPTSQTSIGASKHLHRVGANALTWFDLRNIFAKSRKINSCLAKEVSFGSLRVGFRRARFANSVSGDSYR